MMRGWGKEKENAGGDGFSAESNGAFHLQR